MVKIYMLPADEGDFLWIVYGEEQYSHIIIDGGLEDNAQMYANVIETIYNRKEVISAIILSHIDIDHIQGALTGLSNLSNEVLKNTIHNIYFNTCRGIKKNIDITNTSFGEDDIKVRKKYNGYGVAEAITFLDLLKEKGINDRIINYTVSGNTIILDGGAVLKVISPGEEQLQNLALKWEAYEKKKKVVGYSDNVWHTRENLSVLKEKRLWHDISVNNRSSIAFLFEYKEVRIAFLADAAPDVCISGLKKHGISNSYDVDLFKLSHHGSRSNTSDKLLKALPSKNYLLSTNGQGKKVPSKVMIAHLLKLFERSPVNTVSLLCNYNWWETTYHGEYFTKKDWEEYLLTKKLQLIELDENAFKIKNELEVYGEYD